MSEQALSTAATCGEMAWDDRWSLLDGAARDLLWVAYVQGGLENTKLPFSKHL